MSWITNVVLSFSVGEDTEARAAEVNRFFESVPDRYGGGANYQEEPLASVEPVCSMLECNLYVGAYNYFPLDDFMNHLRSVQWEEPEAVQLFIQDEQDLKFTLIEPLTAAGEKENGVA